MNLFSLVVELKRFSVRLSFHMPITGSGIEAYSMACDLLFPTAEKEGKKAAAAFRLISHRSTSEGVGWSARPARPASIGLSLPN